MVSAVPVTNVRFVQVDRSRTQLTWMHQFFNQVQGFRVSCHYTDIADGSIRNLAAENVTKTACQDHVCSKEQSVNMTMLLPGTMMRCSVQAAFARFGLSDSVVKSIVLIHEPSAPGTPTISHTVDRDFSITKWNFAWESPANNGDGKVAGAPGRAQLDGYDVEIACGSGPQQLSVSSVQSVTLTAIWQASGPSNFVMISSLDVAFRLECSKGGTVTVKVRARNALFSGAWSHAQTHVAIGVPSPVTALEVLEVAGGLNVTWRSGTDTGDGGAELIGFRVESSICEDFDNSN